jgi:hypothetical protein
MISPLAVRMEGSMPPPPPETHSSPVPVEERYWPAVPVESVQSQIVVIFKSPDPEMEPPASKRTSPT